MKNRKNSKSKLSWNSRDIDLENLKRYGKLKVMYYRTNLRIHTKRVGALVTKLAPHFLKYYDLDLQKALLLAEHHDDHELYPQLGDISLQLKLGMNLEEKGILREKEIAAVNKVADAYPKNVGKYVYRELLMHSIEKDCREAQLVSFADKIDGYCEAVHEVLAGNVPFLEPVINYQAKTFSDPARNFPLIRDVFQGRDSLFSFPVVCLNRYFNYGSYNSSVHTPETIYRKTEVLHYEEWKATTLEHFANGLELLTYQQEFYP